MNTWKLEVRKVSNGYILKGKFSDSEVVTESLIEEKIDNDLNAMQQVLLNVMEYFGIYYSKHNDKNIRIIIEDKNGKEIEDNN